MPVIDTCKRSHVPLRDGDGWSEERIKMPSTVTTWHVRLTLAQTAQRSVIVVPPTMDRVGGLVAVVAATLLAACAARQPTAPVNHEHQVTAGVGPPPPPVLSADGAASGLAAVAAGSANPQGRLAAADGAASSRALTHAPSDNYEPEFAPEGRSISVAWWRQRRGVYPRSSPGGQPT